MSALDLAKYNDEGLRERMINIFHDVMADFGQSARDNRFGGALSDMELLELVKKKVLEKVKKLKKPKAKEIRKRCIDVPLRDKKGRIMKDNKGRIIKKQECGPKYEKSSEDIEKEELIKQLMYHTPHGLYKSDKGYDYIKPTKKQKGKLNKLHKDKHPFTYQVPINWQTMFQEQYKPQEFVDEDYQDNPEELDAQELKKMRDIMGTELKNEELEQSGIPEAPPMDAEYEGVPQAPPLNAEKTFVDELKDIFSGKQAKTKLKQIKGNKPAKADKTFVDELKERFSGKTVKPKFKPVKHLEDKPALKKGYEAVMEELKAKVKKRGGSIYGGDIIGSIISHAIGQALNPSKLLKYIPDIAKLISPKKGGAKKKPSEWIKYVKEYKKLNKIKSYSQALKEASKHYKK